MADRMTEPLVLLPGMMCDGRLFGPQIAALSSLFTIQLGQIDGAEAMEAMATEVLGKAPARFALAGQGMGGNVALEVLRRAPDRVSRIALLSTNPFAESAAEAAERDPQIARVRAGRLREVARELLQPDLLCQGARADEVERLAIDMALRMGEVAFIRQSRAMQRRQDQQAVLRRAKVPAMILCGAEDQICPIRRQELMAALANDAELCIVPEAAHLPTLENPQAVSEALGAWMYRL